MSAHKRRKARKKSTKKRTTKVDDTAGVVPVKKKAAKSGKPKKKVAKTGKATPAKKRGKKKASRPQGGKQSKQGAKSKRRIAGKAATDTDKATKRKAPKKQAKSDKPRKKAGKKKPSKKAVLTRARKRRDKGKKRKAPVQKLRAKLRQRGITLQVTYGPGDGSHPKPSMHPAGSVSGVSVVVPPPNVRLPEDRWEGFGSQPTIVLPTPTNKIRSKVYLVTMGREANFSEDDKPGEDIVRFTTSTSGMHSSNDNYLQIFDKAFRHFVDKTPFEDRDDVPFYRFGMAIRSKYKLDEKKIRELIPQFADLAQKILPKGATAHVVDEGNFLSVRINLGNYREPTLYTEAREYIRKNKHVFEALRLGAADLLDGDFVWFEFWDTDELYY